MAMPISAQKVCISCQYCCRSSRLMVPGRLKTNCAYWGRYPLVAMSFAVNTTDSQADSLMPREGIRLVGSLATTRHCPPPNFTMDVSTPNPGPWATFLFRAPVRRISTSSNISRSNLPHFAIAQRFFKLNIQTEKISHRITPLLNGEPLRQSRTMPFNLVFPVLERFVDQLFQARRGIKFGCHVEVIISEKLLRPAPD